MPRAAGAALVVRPAAVGDQLAASVGRDGLLGAVLVAFEAPDAVNVRREGRIGVVLLVVRRHRGPAVSARARRRATSIQCRTGVVVPLCRCWMQPMLAETMVDRRQLGEVRQLAVAQRVGELGLEHRVRSGRAAAEVRLRWWRRARRSRARRSRSRRRRARAGHAATCMADETRDERPSALTFAFSAGTRSGSNLGHVAGQVGDAARLLRVLGVVGERVGVLLHRHAAARRVHDDRLDRAALHHRPPGVDVPAHVVERAVAVAEVQADRAAAAGARRRPASGCRRRRGRARSRC